MYYSIIFYILEYTFLKNFYFSICETNSIIGLIREEDIYLQRDKKQLPKMFNNNIIIILMRQLI